MHYTIVYLIQTRSRFCKPSYRISNSVLCYLLFLFTFIYIGLSDIRENTALVTGLNICRPIQSFSTPESLFSVKIQRCILMYSGNRKTGVRSISLLFSSLNFFDLQLKNLKRNCPFPLQSRFINF